MNSGWLAVSWAVALAASIALALRSGDAYSAHDAEEHATEYGGVIREAHGPITVFLWVCYAGAAVFTVVYSALHWADIAEMISMMGM